MAGGKSNYLEATLLDHVLSLVLYTPPGTIYIALWIDTNTDTQRDANTVTEVSGGSYARVAVANNGTNWPAAAGTTPTSKSNGTTITFPTPTANWGTVTAFGIYDAATSGHLLYWAPLDAATVINTGNVAEFVAGALSVTEE